MMILLYRRFAILVMPLRPRRPASPRHLALALAAPRPRHLASPPRRPSPLALVRATARQAGGATVGFSEGRHRHRHRCCAVKKAVLRRSALLARAKTSRVG